QNRIAPDKTETPWHDNRNWTNEDVTAESGRLNFALTDSIGAYAGATSANYQQTGIAGADGTYLTTNAGVDYRLAIGSVPVTAGYDYSQLASGGANIGAPQHSVSVGFGQSGSTVSGEARLTTGGPVGVKSIPTELQIDGNNVDSKASLKLQVPVLTNVNLWMGGDWVHSQGAAANAYDVSQLQAGLKVDF
ncbi:MAG TPA: hypothetical protein VFK80_10515, partial [Limnochordia bacterium]|nr:hypothetical protein [Limnochordia bacterium]